MFKASIGLTVHFEKHTLLYIFALVIDVMDLTSSILLCVSVFLNIAHT
jgi:hypothetical protein